MAVTMVAAPLLNRPMWPTIYPVVGRSPPASDTLHLLPGRTGHFLEVEPGEGRSESSPAAAVMV